MRFRYAADVHLVAANDAFMIQFPFDGHSPRFFACQALLFISLPRYFSGQPSRPFISIPLSSAEFRLFRLTLENWKNLITQKGKHKSQSSSIVWGRTFM